MRQRSDARSRPSPPPGRTVCKMRSMRPCQPNRRRGCCCVTVPASLPPTRARSPRPRHWPMCPRWRRSRSILLTRSCASGVRSAPREAGCTCASRAAAAPPRSRSCCRCSKISAYACSPSGPGGSNPSPVRLHPAPTMSHFRTSSWSCAKRLPPPTHCAPASGSSPRCARCARVISTMTLSTVWSC